MSTPVPRPTGSLDPQRGPTLFDLVSQVLLRESGDRSLTMVQVRGYSSEKASAVPYDAVIALNVMPTTSGGLTEMSEKLFDTVAANGVNVGLVKGKAETAGLEVGIIRQVRYLDAVQNGEFAIVWLSPRLRNAYRPEVDPSEVALFGSLNIETVEATLIAFLRARKLSTDALTPEIMENVAAYQWRRDAVALSSVQRVQKLIRIYDGSLGLSFLAILDDTGAVLALANLTPEDPASRLAVDLREMTLAKAVEQFVGMRAGLMIFGAAP